MYVKLKLLILLVIMVSLLTVGTVVMASGIMRPINPSDPSDAVQPGNVLIAAPITLPPSIVTYKESPRGVIEVPGDRSVAMLGDVSAKFAESVSVFYSDLNLGSADLSNEIVLTILSSIKYTSTRGDILVTTTKPSVAAAAKSLYLGEREIKLANGMTAWVTAYTHGEFPNRVLFIDSDLIITVASNLSIGDVQNYAAEVVVMHP